MVITHLRLFDTWVIPVDLPSSEGNWAIISNHFPSIRWAYRGHVLLISFLFLDRLLPNDEQFLAWVVFKIVHHNNDLLKFSFLDVIDRLRCIWSVLLFFWSVWEGFANLHGLVIRKVINLTWTHPINFIHQNYEFSFDFCQILLAKVEKLIVNNSSKPVD